MNINEDSIFQTKRMSSRKKTKLQHSDFIYDLDNIDLIEFDLKSKTDKYKQKIPKIDDFNDIGDIEIDPSK